MATVLCMIPRQSRYCPTENKIDNSNYVTLTIVVNSSMTIVSHINWISPKNHSWTTFTKAKGFMTLLDNPDIDLQTLVSTGHRQQWGSWGRPLNSALSPLDPAFSESYTHQTWATSKKSRPCDLPALSLSFSEDLRESMSTPHLFWVSLPWLSLTLPLG